MSKINVKGFDISVVSQGEDDFICLTDMLKAKDGDFFVSDWLRNRNTVEFLSVWEKMNNPDFNYGEFDVIKSKSGLNSFRISAKEWIDKTKAIGIQARTGRYGGTYAHKDIAFEFGMWVSAEFKLLLIKEFQRLKEEESQRIESGWDYRRFLSKTNYVIHTDAIKEHIIPELTEAQAKFAYANEADMLNVALFGMTAKQWQQKYPEDHSGGHNMRSFADIHQLIVLTNLESTNAFLVSQKVPLRDRLLHLRKMAIDQLKSLRNSKYTIDKIKSPYKHLNNPTSKKMESGDMKFDKAIDNLLKVKPKPE